MAEKYCTLTSAAFRLSSCTGMTRSPEKLHFHLNTALTAVSLAKAAYYLSAPPQERKAFSMADVKTQYANDLLLDRFIATFGIGAQLSKINSIRERFRAIGKIAA